MAIVIQIYRPGDEIRVHCLVNRVFEAFIAPDYGAEGQRMFLDYIHWEKLAERQSRCHQMLLAECDGELAGVIELRDFRHISMLFVAAELHRRGVARALFDRAVALCRRVNPDLAELTVNSSPYALAVYRRLGFVAAGTEECVHGIRYTPMRLALSPHPTAGA